MITYQDLLAVTEDDLIEFVRATITKYKSSDEYKNAVIASDYDRQKNTTISEYRKLLYTMAGNTVPDNWSANFKIPSGFYGFFVIQQNQFLLGNGITWKDQDAADKAFGKKHDVQIQKAGHKAVSLKVAFVFYNKDHLEVFDPLDFIPLYDEETGHLMAGIRFWQIDPKKPLRAVLYELDGYTEFIWRETEGEIYREKDHYITNYIHSEVDGTEIVDKQNYPSFPIVPLWGNPNHQCELDGKRESIDAYDLIKSGFANDLDDASQIYWTIQNAGGMDDIDLVKFLERMHTVKAAVVEDGGAKAESHTIDVPYAAREGALDRIEKDLYRDFMAFNPQDIAGGAVTATQIKAAYEPLNTKCDQYEYCVHECLDALCALAGMEDNEATFTRSMIVNTQEEISILVSAAQYLEEDYLIRKILTLLGDGDMADELIEKIKNEKAMALEVQKEIFGDQDEEEPEEEEIEE